MSTQNNPLLNEAGNKYNSVPFSKIKAEHFIPALNHSIEQAKKIIDSIADSNNPTFENTVISFENAFDDIEHIVTVYYHYFASIADDSIRALVSEISNINTKFNNDIYLNENLFKNIKSIYEDRDNLNLDSDDNRLLEELFNSFIRSGANLSAADKNQYRKITEELSQLSPKFSNNVLNATNDINEYWISNKDDLKGLPENSIEAARLYASKKNRDTEWCFTLDTNIGIILKNCENRSIREDI